MKAHHLFAMLAAAAVVGCSGPNQTYTDGQGNKAVVSGDGSTISVETKDGQKSTTDTASGKTTWTDGEKGGSMEAGAEVTEAELGLPFYPGSTVQENSGMKMDTTEGSIRTTVRTTSDLPAKVAEFYKAKLKDAGAYSSSNDGNETSTVGGKLDDDRTASVVATRDKDATSTTISITVTQEKKK